MQVMTQKEAQMPRFKHEDRVRILPESSAPYAGETGTIFGDPSLAIVIVPTQAREGQSIAGEQPVIYEHEVCLDRSDKKVRILESDLESA